jgi:multidrug efflux pump subunit AcrA (membrane-fusion protein)
MKLMSVVLLIAIVVYIGLYIYRTADNPLRTAVAVLYTAEETGAAEGYVVRSETVLTGSGAVTLMVSEGDKVASGEELAISYEGETALERASQIRALQLQINAAEENADASSELKKLDAGGSVLALSNAVQHRNLEDLQALSFNIESLIFKDAGKDQGPDLNALKEQLNKLLAQNTDTQTIAAPMSGVFSAVVDGYESTGPDKLKDLTPTSLQALFPDGQKTDSGALGKLITGITWYYAAVVDESDAVKLQAIVDKAASAKPAYKPAATLQFTKTYNTKLTMTIESVGQAENGKCVAVFSSKSNLTDITALRKLSAQILFDTDRGLLVPTDAVHYKDDGTAYVYLLKGLQAKEVGVTVLAQNGDSYVLEDGAESGTALREGSEIIVRAKDLYDGKVVAQ